MGLVAFLKIQSIASTATIIDDLTLSSIRRVETDFIHLGLSANLMWVLKAESSFSSSLHFSVLISQSSRFQLLLPNGTLLTTKFRVGMSSARFKP